MKKDKNQRIFRNLGIASLVSVYLVILAGGVVRSTGSGMGCPDWPRCFGYWVPPTAEEQLPEDYKEVFKAKRHKKNEKLAKYLAAFNLKDLAYQVLNEETDPVNLQFNVEKTFIEYINRVFGVVTGFLFILSFIFSFSYRRTDKGIILLSFLNLLLISVQGWIGSLVVSTDLLPWMVTVHMLITFLIMGLLIFLVVKVSRGVNHSRLEGRSWLNLLVVSSLILTILQVVFGTEVRESIDQIARTFSHAQRGLWIQNLGTEFFLHRSFSWSILVINLFLVILLIKKVGFKHTYSKVALAILVIILIEMISGIGMAYLSIPAFLQPVHLLMATLIFGLQFFLWLAIKSDKPSVYFSSPA